MMEREDTIDASVNFHRDTSRVDEAILAASKFPEDLVESAEMLRRLVGEVD